MEKLNLLFTKGGLQYQILLNKAVLKENSYFENEESTPGFLSNHLDELLSKKFAEISVVSALNHFALAPEGFSEHDLGYDLIAFNSNVEKNAEELMLSVNKKFGLQFYYAFPLDFYKKIKAANPNSKFNFSGEKFLSSIAPKSGKEIHINLYHYQCEFFSFENKKVLLYNNLDLSSEVDFLYFVMFTLSKIGFGTNNTQFYVYGETSENQTFISELQKFVKNLKISYDNLPKKNLMMAN